MFRSSDDYHELNAGAHRNSPKYLYAPALTWHLGFWIDKASSDQQQNPGQIVDVKTELDNFLLALCKALKDNKTIKEVRLRPGVHNKAGKLCFLLFKTVADEHFVVTDSSKLTRRQEDIWKSSNRAVSVKFKWHEICLSIRCEKHKEYFSITTFAELENDPDLENSKGFNLEESDENLEKLNGKIADARSYFDKKWTEPESKTKKKAIEAGLHQYFFRDFWDLWLSYYKDAVAASQGGIFDRIFADFRGIVLSEKAITLPSDKKFFGGKFFGGSELPSWGAAARKKFFPLLNAHNKDIELLRQYECSVSYMLAGRAIYMSALAPQLPDSPDDDRIPLEYIVYAHQHVPSDAKKASVNKWELGRLINQLHGLGILRLAALKDVKLLHDVGSQLLQLDSTIKTARESLAPNAQTAIKSIKEAHKQFNDITGYFIDNAKCDLAYRIGRSRYYVGQVRSNVVFLRVTRLEGYQPYDQFVERRLGGEFDFIDRLGGRYERAANNISMLDQNYLSIETSHIDADTKEIDSDIKAIQKGGEIALLAVLVPYYVSHILAQFVPESLVPILTILTWTLCAAWAVSRFSRNYVSRVGAWCIGLYSGLFSGLLIVLLFGKFVSLGWNTSIFPRFPDTPRDLLEVERDLLAAQKEHDRKLLETQSKQLKVQNDLLDAWNALREKEKDAPPRLPPTHRKPSVQQQRVAR